MKRRNFVRGLASLSVAPAMPVPAMGAVAGAGTATAEHMYFVSWYVARINDTCSQDMLMSELNLSRDVAREVFGKLVHTNTVSPPNALGISRTIDPLTHHVAAVGHSAAQSAPAKMAQATDTPKRISLKIEEPALPNTPEETPEPVQDVESIPADLDPCEDDGPKDAQALPVETLNPPS
jgi:hypothetical protein